MPEADAASRRHIHEAKGGCQEDVGHVHKTAWVFHVDQDLEIALVVGSLHLPKLSLQTHLSHAPPPPPRLLSSHFPSITIPRPPASVVPVTLAGYPGSHPEAHASFRGPFSSLPSAGDNSPTLAGLPTQISDSSLPWQQSWALRGREANECFKEAEASALQEHDYCSTNPGKSRPPRPHPPRPAGFATL